MADVRVEILRLEGEIFEKSAWVEYMDFAGLDSIAESQELETLEEALAAATKTLDTLTAEIAALRQGISEKRDEIDRQGQLAKSEHSAIRFFESQQNPEQEIIKSGDTYRLEWNVSQVWVNPSCTHAVFESRGNPAEIGSLVIFMETGCQDTGVLEGVFSLSDSMEWQATQYNHTDSPSWHEIQKWERKAQECRELC